MKACQILIILLLACAQAVWAQSYETPEATLNTYLEACKAGDFEAAEMCYTRSGRELVKQDTAEMEPRSPELLKGTYERLKDVDFKLEQVNAKRAIFWPDDEQVPPMFVRIQEPEERWRLDYHFMSRYIRVDENGWAWRNKRLLDLWKKRE